MIRSASLILGAMILGVACGDGGPADLSGPVPATIMITPPKVTLAALGQTVQLTAAARDQGGQTMTGVAFVWASSDQSVAQVDATGLVTAVGNGTAEITAASRSGVVGKATVTVSQQASQISIGPDAYTLTALRDTLRITAEAVDANGNPIARVAFMWSSSDERVATVDTTGLVTAQRDGSAAITAASGPARASAAISVSQEPARVLVSPMADTLLSIRDTLRLSAEAVDANGNPVGHVIFAWSSSNESVVTVSSSGVAVAASNGSARVTAKSGDAEGSSALTVAQRAVEMRLFSTVDTLRALDDTLRIVAELVDANGYPLRDLPALWSSSDDSVAKVDETGLVTTIAPGKVRITAEFVGSDFAGTTTIVIELRPRDILIELYKATGGPDWNNDHNWLTDAPMASWYGVEADGAGRVFGLNLRENGLTGSLPRELGYLEDLRGLRIADNSLAGAIPAEFGRLENLTVLDASRNALSGSIPTGLGDLANLTLLWLTGNLLSGPIPPELGKLRLLTQLHLTENALTGPIPPELGNLSGLRELRLNHNNLIGSIPAELGDIVTLVNLYLYGNSLSGSIPPRLGNLEALRNLHLDDNALSGSIPPELGNLTELQSLLLHHNRLTGAIPSELGRLENLTSARLNDNLLTGPIPPQLGRTALHQLFLQNNALTGPIPGELGELSNLNFLDLSDNALTGPIPPELERLEKVRTLKLGDNQLTGTLPPEMHAMLSLASLRIRRNPLSGPIPQAFVALRLFDFDWTETELCAPRNEVFQAWLRSINRHSGGATCPP